MLRPLSVDTTRVPASEGQGPKGRRGGRGLRHLVLVLILLVMVPILSWQVEEHSPTSDEWAHFIRGVSYWTTGDTQLSYAHPPLANAIAGLPFVLEKNVPDLRDYKAWKRATVSGVYHAYTREDYPRARAQLVRGRRVMMVFPLLLVAYAYFFCLRQFGYPSAVAAAVLLAFNPNVLAHGQLITTDLPAALGYLIAAGEFVRYLQTRGPPWQRALALVGMSLAVSFAVLVKHSGMLLVPILVGIGLVAAIRGGVGAFQGSRSRRVLVYAGHVVVTALIMVLCVNGAYRFQHTGLRVDEILERKEPQYWISSPYKHEMLEKKSPLASLPAGLRIPLPYTEIVGLTAIRAQNDRGWFRSYFLGKQQPDSGTRLYLPVMLLIKTPLAVLLLLGTLPFAVLRRRRLGERPWPTLATAVVLTVLVYFCSMVLRSNLNMGMRHLMPAVPLMSVLAARAFQVWWCEIWDIVPIARRVLRGLLVAVLVPLPISTTLSTPHHLGYFNAAIGRELGHEISIIGEDWGQDLLRLARHAQAHDLQPLYVVEHTGVNKRELQWSGLKYRRLKCKGKPRPGSYVAIRAAVVKTRRDKCHRWSVGKTPVAVIHHHIYVYRIP